MIWYLVPLSLNEDLQAETIAELTRRRDTQNTAGVAFTGHLLSRPSTTGRFLRPFLQSWTQT
jgi:hypothetical protein